MINHLRPHFNTLRLLFELRINSIDTVMQRAYKDKLRFVNLILNSALGVKITMEKNDKLKMFYMAPNGGFGFNVAMREWVTTLAE